MGKWSASYSGKELPLSTAKEGGKEMGRGGGWWAGAGLALKTAWSLWRR